MGNKTITKPLRIIKTLKIHIHGILYVTTYIVLKNNVVDSNYSMLLGRPWLRYAKVTHVRNNVIIVQGNGIIKTILINKKLGAETRRPQIFVCYDLLESDALPSSLIDSYVGLK